MTKIHRVLREEPPSCQNHDRKGVMEDFHSSSGSSPGFIYAPLELTGF